MGRQRARHALADEALGDADQRNSASGRDVAGGGVVADEQFRSRDFGGEGGERSIVRSHAGWQSALDAFALLGGAAFVDEDGRAGLRPAVCSSSRSKSSSRRLAGFSPTPRLTVMSAGGPPLAVAGNVRTSLAGVVAQRAARSGSRSFPSPPNDRLSKKRVAIVGADADQTELREARVRIDHDSVVEPQRGGCFAAGRAAIRRGRRALRDGRCADRPRTARRFLRGPTNTISR